MAERIDTTTGRARLKVRREPYWARIEQGSFIGFRKLPKGEGTWIARWRNAEGQHYRALGHHPDYDAAVKAARQWFAQCDGATPKMVTVAEACRQYVAERRARKGDANANDAEGRFKRHVYDATIGKLELAKLKAADIEKWLHGLIRNDDEDEDAERRSKDSANRNLAALKAALNRAFHSGLVASDAQWRRVRSFEDVSRRRERFLTLTQRKRLYVSASPELKRLIKAVALTAARPGEIAAARVADLDSKAGMITLSGKTGRRTIPLSPDAIAFFKSCYTGRDASAPLIVRDSGIPWNKWAWGEAMREAVTQAKLPDDVVLYSVRHAAISEMLTAKLDPLSVARLAGTSVNMISKHYGHLVQDHVRAQLAAVKVL
ncbi:MAG: tyrosine-type recombinase/integrase [Betaproteobacteria bacterium]|nr:tyrosine-type recombinase/integrase [Betaproteobacteria bacterium]